MAWPCPRVGSGRPRPGTGVGPTTSSEPSGPPADRGRLPDDGGHRTEARQLRQQIHRFGQRQPACRALVDAHYGIGPLIAVVVWSELGDCRRFSRSMQVVRHTGLDPTVDASDRRRSSGFLSRQGPQTLRWALFEAGMAASKTNGTVHEQLGLILGRRCRSTLLW